MGFLERALNQRVKLAAPQPETDVKALDAEQWATLVDALELDDTATIDEMIAAVTTVCEIAKTAVPEPETTDDKIAAAHGNNVVVIDRNTWSDMQHDLQRGVTAKMQERRLEAEQVVDQAIRLGKASSTQRENWIKAYHVDKQDTIHRLANAKEIPRIEIGYSIDPDPEGLHDKTENRWVR